MKKAIVHFKIGRGGRFYNQGHLSCYGVDRKGHTCEDNLFINPENAEAVIKALVDEGCDIDVVRDNLYDKGHDEFCDMYGIARSELGEDVYFDGGGNYVGDLPDEDGNYHLDFDGPYDTRYGRAIDSYGELTEAEQSCLSEYDLDMLSIYDVDDVPRADVEVIDEDED
jgi:hypothetical protein